MGLESFWGLVRLWLMLLAVDIPRIRKPNHTIRHRPGSARAS